jgi:hypothetical protein
VSERAIHLRFEREAIVSKQHYEFAASQVRQLIAGGDVHTAIVVAGEFATLFQTFSPKFNRARFLAACEVR